MPSKANKHLAKRRKQNQRRRRAKIPSLRVRVLSLGVKLILVGFATTLILVFPFRFLNPPTSSIMLQRSFSAFIEERPGPRYQWRDANDISPELAVAVIAAEDQKFSEHFGFDFGAILDAIEERRQRSRGASTISQQVAKNLYLWPGRSLFRKGIEAYFTLFIEALWPKSRILEVYLNIAEFGPNVFGADAASRMHFGKSANQLSREECTRLAAVLPNPAKLSASGSSDYVAERSAAIGLAAERMGGLAVLRQLENQARGL